MKKSRVVYVGFAAVVAVLLLPMVFIIGRGSALAQGQIPNANAISLTAMPLPATGDQRTSSSTNPQAPDAKAAPDMPSSPAQTFSYYNVIGSAFRPRNSTSTVKLNVSGCYYQTGGTDNLFDAPLLIPDGSVIKYVRFYYLRYSPQPPMTVYLTRYKQFAYNQDLTSIMSGTFGGYDSVLSPLIDETVDMSTYAYVLSWNSGSQSIDNQICAVRVAYVRPVVFGTFLPQIQRAP